jgi:hypothetical protein
MRFRASERKKKEAKKVCKTPPTAKNPAKRVSGGKKSKQSNMPLLDEFVIPSLEEDTEECSPLACNGIRKAEPFALLFFFW